MPPKNQTKKTAGGRQRLERDRVGDLFADVTGETGEGKESISFRRSWYSPPFSEDGEVDYERAADELSNELIGGTLVLRTYLENGDLGYAADITVESKEELERILRTIRKVYVESLKHDNAIRQAGLESCKARIAELEEPTQLSLDRRDDTERRMHKRRGRQLLGRVWFRKNDRRADADRRGAH